MTDVVRSVLRARSSPVVWVFHDVSDRLWFERCVDRIAACWTVIPLLELVGRPRRRTCAITFDDGRKSIWTVAHSVLQERGLPYTVFLCTDVLSGGPVPWFLRVEHLIDHRGIGSVREHWGLDDMHFPERSDVVNAMKEIPFASLEEGLLELEDAHGLAPPDPTELFLSSDDVAALASAGVQFGSHTHRHPILSRLSPEDQRLELEASATIIEDLTGRAPLEFAYPNGSPLDFDQVTVSALRRSGYSVAVTTTQRYLNAADDRFHVPRIGIDHLESSFHTLAKALVPSLSRSHKREERARTMYQRLSSGERRGVSAEPGNDSPHSTAA